MNQYLKEIGKIAANDKDIVERYPRAAFNEIIERRQTKGGELVVITTPKYKLIACHTARRSFITNAFHRNAPTISIMSNSGHKTERQFMKYIKATPTEHAEILMDAFRSGGTEVERR